MEDVLIHFIAMYPSWAGAMGVLSIIGVVGIIVLVIRADERPNA
jgi:hypothetical protein